MKHSRDSTKSDSCCKNFKQTCHIEKHGERKNHRKQKTIMSKKTNKEREGRTCWKADTNSAHILQREKT